MIHVWSTADLNRPRYIFSHNLAGGIIAIFDWRRSLNDFVLKADGDESRCIDSKIGDINDDGRLVSKSSLVVLGDGCI